MVVDTATLFAESWVEHVARARESSPSYEESEYTVTGRAPAPYVKRTLDWWRDKGPGLVDNWVQWRIDHPDFVTWDTPDNTPAIELELNVVLPGDIPVKMFIDNVFVNTKSGEILVVDKKTGARMPETPEQLGLYATGIELAYGPAYRPAWGFWWDANKGTHSNPMHLDKYTPDYFAKAMSMAARGVNAGVFLPKVANGCPGWCSVARFCGAANGMDAKGVDPLA